ncbi:MAG: hypothetical protein A2W73_04945 [Deltaproteobacteria bacterium RIFCSPLOWO2_12_55_13]|nr:MAG: hypothetical protein A2W73_04945 [Deltaproteobacteria bacterium RIFCSPLOWO2_12_55_13]
MGLGLRLSFALERDDVGARLGDRLGEMIASSSFFDTKRGGSGSPFSITRDFYISGIPETWKRAAVRSNFCD